MIETFRHKGLKRFYEMGDPSRLQPQHAGKISLNLTSLDAATIPEEMNIPGYGLHPLKGDQKGFWAVKVDKNYRIIFRFRENHVRDVDYIDYH